MLQQVLQAKLFTPVVPDEFRGVSARDQDFHHEEIPCADPKAEECGRFAETWLEKLIVKCDELGRIKDVSKVLRRLRHVFDQLGRRGFVYAVRHSVACQLDAKIVQLLQYTEDAPERRKEAEQLKDGMARLKSLIDTEVSALENGAKDLCPDWEQLSPMSAKARKLVEVLKKQMPAREQQEGRPPFRSIVLVHETMLPRPLADLLNLELGVEPLGVKAVAVCGSTSMVADDRKRAIEDFRSGTATVLVGTPAVEEGLDIPECQLVVRFDKYSTTQSHIQGSGRARHVNAKIICFENDPAKAQKAAKRMLSSARNPDMRPSEADAEAFRDIHATKRARLEGKHPFGGEDGAEVSIYNSKDIVYAYCSKVMKDAFRAESLFQWTEESPQQLLSVSYPTPDGLQTVIRQDVEEYWRGIDASDVFDATRCKRWTTKDREQVRFLFLVARRLREARHLDSHNQPTVRAREMTSIKCPMPKAPVAVTISSKYPKVKSTQGVSNPKGLLKEWADRAWAEKGDAVLRYESREVPGGFRAKVHVIKLKLNFEGDVCKSKKLAEQSAAEKALEHPEVGPS